MNCNKLTFGLIVFCTTMAAMAAHAASGVNCQACSAADSLRVEIQKLNYSNDSDKFKGGQKARAAVTQLQAFEAGSRSSPTRQQAFKSLLDLSREAAPYDGEAQLADVLSNMVEKDSSLRTQLSKFLAGQSQTPNAELCKSKLFESEVAVDMCLQDNGVKGQGGNASNKVMQKCSQRFNYDDCLSAKK